MQVEATELKVPLSSTVLRSSGLAKVDKTRSITAFIHSQRSYLSNYAKEGQAVRASWDLSPPRAGDAESAPRAHERAEVQSELGTLILQPRVPEDYPQKENILPNHKKTPPRKYKENVAVRATSKKTKSPGKKRVPSSRTLAEEDNRNNVTMTDKKQATLNEFIAKRRKTAGKKRQRSPDDSDEERNARLTERRERRRTNRAIVQPKTVQPPSGEEEEASNIGKGKGQDKRGKRKGPSMSAGLALMHGFSAANIGKNRLTLKPEKTIGVFSKGKASARTAVESMSKKRQQSDVLFSEDIFLNRTTQASTSKHDPVTPTSDKSASSASTRDNSDSAESRPRKIRKLTKRATVSKAIAKKPLQDDPSVMSLSTVEDLRSVITNETRPTQLKRKNGSIIWDIELGRSLDAVSEPSALSKVQQESTIILNTLARPWAPGNDGHISQPHAAVLDQDMSSDTSASQDRGLNAETLQASGPRMLADSASLCPSQSASQVGRRLVPLAAPPTPASVARYFGRPVPQETPFAHDIAHIGPIEQGSQPSMEPRISPDPPEATNQHNITTEISDPVTTADNPVDGRSSAVPEAGERSVQKLSRSRPPYTRNSLSEGSLASLARELTAFEAGGIDLPGTEWLEASDLAEQDRAPAYAVQQVRYIGTSQCATQFPAGVNGIELETPLTNTSDFADHLLQPESPEHYGDNGEGMGDSTGTYSYVGDYDSDGPNFLHPDAAETYNIPVFSEDERQYEEHLASVFSGPLPSDDTRELDVEDDAMDLEPVYGAEDDLEVNFRSDSVLSYISSQESASLEEAPEGATVVALQRFSQGRALLLGLPEAPSESQENAVDLPMFDAVTSVEQNVAKHLRGHWLPQRW